MMLPVALLVIAIFLPLKLYADYRLSQERGDR